MKKFRLYLRKNPHLWYILFLPAFLICFFALEKFVDSDRVIWWVSSPLDGRIPFLEGFVLAYYLWYPLLALTGFLLLWKDVPNFKKYMQFLIFGFGAALLFCLLIPNGQDLRPGSFARDNVFTRLVGLMYSVDTNTNVFPSMHVIGSVAAAAAVCRSGKLKPLRPLWLVVAVAISLSTVFIKQHSVLDIFGGILFCLPIYLLLYGRKGGKTSA